MHFDSEIVRLFIEGDSLEVEGIYRFVCHPSRVPYTIIYYPYPADSLLGAARTVLLERRIARAPWETMKIEDLPESKGILWKLPLSAGDTVEVHTVYRQALLASYARYIVTTTRHWKRPLRRARFEIYLQEGAKSPQFSYPFKWHTAERRGFYLYETTDFWPDRDIIVRWVP